MAARKLLNAKEAADMLGVPESWVLANARARRLPSVQAGLCVDYRHKSSFSPAVEYVRADVAAAERQAAYKQGWEDARHG